MQSEVDKEKSSRMGAFLMQGARICCFFTYKRIVM